MIRLIKISLALSFLLILFQNLDWAMYPPIVPSSFWYSSHKSTLPYEMRIGEDVDVGVQHDFWIIFMPFPIKNDEDIFSVRMNESYYTEKISKKRLRLKHDVEKISSQEIDSLVGSKKVFIDFNNKTSSSKDYSDQASVSNVYIRTQNGFQNFVKSDYKKSETTAGLLSLFPGMGYLYADEMGWGLSSFFFRSLLWYVYFSKDGSYSPLLSAAIALTTFNEAKSSIDIVKRKNRVALALREKRLTSEADLLKSDLSALQDKKKKFVKYPKIPFGISYGLGFKIFPFNSSENKSFVAYGLFSIGFRDYYFDSFRYSDSNINESTFKRVTYYDDFYSLGWKNAHHIQVNGNTWGIGGAKVFHSEWIDLKGLFDIGCYDKPISFGLEGMLNLSPLTYIDGTYVEVYSPY